LEAIIGIIIVFWVLTSLLGGGKKQQRQGPRRPMSGMPPFTGGPGMPRPPLQRTKRQPVRQEERSGGSIGDASPSAGLGDPHPWSQRADQDDQTSALSGEIYRSQSSSYEPEEPASHATEAYEIQRAAPDSDRLSRTVASASSGCSGQTKRDASKDANRTVPNQNEVLKGIIWSEILGPPKSRRRIRS